MGAQLSTKINTTWHELNLCLQARTAAGWRRAKTGSMGSKSHSFPSAGTQWAAKTGTKHRVSLGGSEAVMVNLRTAYVGWLLGLSPFFPVPIYKTQNITFYICQGWTIVLKLNSEMSN